MAQGLSGVVPAAMAKQADNAVTQGGESLRGTAGMSLAAVLAQGFISDVVDFVFDGPVAPPEGLDLRRPCQVPASAGDTVGGFAAHRTCAE